MPTAMSKKLLYLDTTADVELRVADLLNRLTMNEKFKLLTSYGLLRLYTTPSIKRLAIPSFKMTDGPLGVAMHSSGFKKNTRFPATISLAASWNRDLLYRIGIAMGEETRAVGRHVLLAPGMNIARTPLNGRTFEYYSEDPYLTKELTVPFVKGVQSKQVAACLKHFAANNQETDRRKASSEIDERTLHEIYLRAFRATVFEAHPWSVMTAYNKVNGVSCCENRYLVRETLIDKWGFEGLVMTDWFASRSNQTTAGCINAGLCLEMPWPSKYKRSPLEQAFSEGKFTEDTLNDLVRRNLRVMFWTGLFDPQETLPKGSRNTPEHQTLARQAAEEGMVLLKNENATLPLDINNIKRISVHGPNLRKKFGRLLSGGSSAVSPPYEVTPLEGITAKCRGRVGIFPNDTTADVAIVFAGLNHGRGKDTESTDRTSLQLDEKQVELIKRVADSHEQTVVCLIAGSPIVMDQWIDDVDAVIMCWYGGLEAGHAIANVLFGDVNPSGRLPVTFPKRIEDSPAHSTGDPRNYPGDEEKHVFYDERIFVGYRWFDEKEIESLFPFGFGLSYTKFKIDSINLSKDTLVNPEDSLQVELELANTGSHAGADVIQIYARDIESSVERPPKELVGFEKVHLEPGEMKKVSIGIKAENLGFYDVEKHDWHIEDGDFEILVAKSCQDIKSALKFNYIK
jgi:beta-glucosidase